MCWECFKRYTNEPVVNDRVIAAADLIRQSDEQNGAADTSLLLHVILGDMNLDDVYFDLVDAARRGRYDQSEPWERTIFDTMAALTEAERATVAAIDWGYLDHAGKGSDETRRG